MLSTKRVITMFEDTLEDLHNDGHIEDFHMEVLLPDNGDGRVTFAIAVGAKP